MISAFTLFLFLFISIDPLFISFIHFFAASLLSEREQQFHASTLEIREVVDIMRFQLHFVPDLVTLHSFPKLREYGGHIVGKKNTKRPDKANPFRPSTIKTAEAMHVVFRLKHLLH